MSRASLAQMVLALFTTPDRAASIVGDLLEESRSRRVGSFSLHVLGVAAALCASSVASTPWRSACRAGASCLVWSIIYLVMIYGTGVLDSFPVYPGYLELGLILAPLGFWIGLVSAIILSNFLTGAIVTYSSSLSGTCAPLVVLWTMCWIAWPFLAALLYSLSWPWIAAGAVAFPFLYLIPLLGGSALARCRRPM